MRRGFLNGKKAKDKLSDDRGSTAAPSLTPQPEALKIRWPSDPVVGTPVTIPNPGHREPYAVSRFPPIWVTRGKESFSVCIITQSTSYKIINTPGYYTPPPSRNAADYVFTKNTPNMGTGLFAKRNLAAGDIILFERPLILRPKAMVVGRPPELSSEEVIKYSEATIESIFERALNTMIKEDADAYSSLSNCFRNGPPLTGIFNTNAFGAFAIEEPNWEEEVEYCCVTKLASRMNHSCMPSVTIKFDIPTFSLHVIALRAINAGDQLFYCYCRSDRSAKERQRQLNGYSFVCKCKACVNATPESDKLREELDDKYQKVLDEVKEIYANPRSRIRALLKLETDIVKEGLDYGEKFVALLKIISGVYAVLRDRVKEREYLGKVKKVSFIEV